MAVPGVAPPIAWEGDLLCDGGVLDNLPTDVMARFERGAIVASNVSGEGAIAAPGAGHVEPDPEALLHRRGDDVPRLSEILMRSATLNGPGTMARAAERADVYMRMPSQDYGMFDWKAIDDLIALGYEHAMAVLEPVVGQLREGVSVAASAA
jgi:NTE family protein